MKILVTGATGKVGQTFIQRFLAERNDGSLRAFCHHRMLESTDRLEVVQGSLANKADVDKAMEEITHVLHLATCKETPDDVIDVTVKGLFWLLESCRQNPNFQQFLMVGGDAAMGHFVYPHPVPVTEQQKHMSYQGCYALSKVLEEVMLEQYYIQYNLNGCCLRAPWIMEKDDFKFSLSFGEDVFGGPRWIELVGIKKADQYVKSQTIPILLDIEEQPIKRNFVHVEDLVSSILKAVDHPKAFQQLFNICMDQPVDYGQVADHLRQTRGLPSIGVQTEYHSTWMDNTKAKFLLDWQPDYDLARLIDEAWDYQRSPNDPRKIWYPG
ncbi:UDP-glucose 4-epimerase [Candidatus Poribacteria bacterium]|nr:UDP-glucose 4-epimerase [Candidatus Poribacteria bacterium]